MLVTWSWKIILQVQPDSLNSPIGLLFFFFVFDVWKNNYNPARFYFLQVQNELSIILFLMPWTISEVIRYAFYVFALLNRLPHVLVWLRYTLFIVLYPIGVTVSILHWTYRMSPPQKKNYNQTFSINNFQNCELTWICFRNIKYNYLHFGKNAIWFGSVVTKKCEILETKVGKHFLYRPEITFSLDMYVTKGLSGHEIWSEMSPYVWTCHTILTLSLREPDGPCTKPMAVLESCMERVNRFDLIILFICMNAQLGTHLIKKFAQSLHWNMWHFQIDIVHSVLWMNALRINRKWDYLLYYLILRINSDWFK